MLIKDIVVDGDKRKILRGGKMVRSFEVRTYKQGLVCDLARQLNEKLVKLQEDGWKNHFCCKYSLQRMGIM